MRIFKIAVVAVAIIAFANQCSASITVEFDLNDGSFVDLVPVGSQSDTYTGVYQSPLFQADTPVVIDQGATEHFWFIFKDGNIMQHLQLTDKVSGGVGALPAEGVIFDVGGTGVANVNPIIRLSGATGSYRPTNSIVDHEDVIGAFGEVGELFDDGMRVGEFSDLFPNDPAFLPGSSIDVTNETLYFHDVHLEIFNAGPDPIDISSLQFFAIANDVQIGEWPVPEPTMLVVWAMLGGIGSLSGFYRRRQ